MMFILDSIQHTVSHHLANTFGLKQRHTRRLLRKVSVSGANSKITFKSLKYLSKEDIAEAIQNIGFRAEFREKLFFWRKSQFGIEDETLSQTSKVFNWLQKPRQDDSPSSSPNSVSRVGLQLLQTSVSLVVDDDCDSSELEEEEIPHASNNHASLEFNSESAYRSTAGTDNPNKWQQLPVTKSSIATSAESNSYWRGLVEDDFVPATAAARPTAAAIRATPATSTAAVTTSTAFTTAAAVSTAAATTSAPTAAAATFAATAAAPLNTAATATAAATSTATAAALTATAVTTAKAAAASIAALRATVASKAASTSTATTRKDRRPKLGKRRRKQPAIREPLAALEKEQKLYELRDRQRQEYVADKSYRRPYAQAKKEQDSSDESEVVSVRRGNSTVARKSAGLKNILKNSGGLSLSEILQQKNLSLDDLLKGKQTALLALQTTAATATQQKPQSNVRSPTHQRRKSTPQPATATTAISSQESSEELDAIKQTKQPKQKLKLPALQRLKLFGASSRATANSGEVSTTGKHKNSTGAATRASSTTTTTTSTTTKRVPIYRKRQQLLQRSTLKPLGLLKSTAIAATTTMSTTAAENKTSTILNAILEPAISSRESSEEFKEAQNDENNETDLLSSTTTNKPTAITIAVAATVTTTSTNSIASSSVISKIQTRYDKNPKTNIIEIDEQPRKSTDSADAAVTYAADDDLEDFFEESTTKGFSNSSSSPGYSSVIDRVTPRLDRQSARPTNDYDNLSYVDPVDDRTDLLELIEDRRSGNRLFKVLEQRNMTLEELIEHRKRGSSQLHLAMVVQNRSRFFPDKKVILRDNMDIVTAFENFPHFNLMNLKSVKPDEIKTDSQGSSYFTSIIDIEPTDEIYKDENKDAGSGSNSGSNLKGPTYAQPQRSEKSLGVFPPWKTFALASLAHPAHAAVSQQQQFFLPQPKLLLDNTSDDSSNLQELPAESVALLNEDNIVANPVDTVEAIENEVARAHDLLDLELSGHGFKRSPAAVAASMTKQQHNSNNSIYGNMPAGIRSAIVASAAIVLTSLATFMVIFVVCRWKQHKQRKTNYMKTYNAMKSKLPMIATTPTSRQSSLHSHHIELDSSLVQSTTHQHSHAHQQQKQAGTRLFRSSSNHSLSCGAVGGIGISTSTLLSAGRPGGLGTGSTTSLALSLTSTHNVSSTKLNTMDPNSPEVQEYLYDALRKSF